MPQGHQSLVETYAQKTVNHGIAISDPKTNEILEYKLEVPVEDGKVGIIVQEK